MGNRALTFKNSGCSQIQTSIIDGLNGGHLIVVDLEYTAWEGSLAEGWSRPGQHREVVQVGAVRLDAENDLAEIGSLDVLVAPQRNPVLSDYFIELTGITNERIAVNAIDLTDALDRLCRFAAGAQIVSNGSDNQVVAENCVLIGVANPLADVPWTDIGPMLRNAIGVEHLHSADIPQLLGLPAPGRGHDALADARAIAAGLRHLRAEGRI